MKWYRKLQTLPSKESVWKNGNCRRRHYYFYSLTWEEPCAFSEPQFPHQYNGVSDMNWASSTFTEHSHGLGLLPLLFHSSLVRRWGRVYRTPFPQAWRHIKSLIFGQGDPELYVGLKSFIPYGRWSGESLFWILRNEEFKMVKAKALGTPFPLQLLQGSPSTPHFGSTTLPASSFDTTDPPLLVRSPSSLGSTHSPNRFPLWPLC